LSFISVFLSFLHVKEFDFVTLLGVILHVGTS
jgi:hypothetical protein